VRVVLDTNVLYGQFPRYMLLSLAVRGLLFPVWSPAILDEWYGVLTRDGFQPDAVMKQRRKLEADWPEALVAAPLPPAPIGLELPDPNDWPIIATAIVGRASTILTYDRGHFPHRVLRAYGLRARHPDRWCADLVRSSEDVAADVYAALRDHLADLKKPVPWTSEQYRAKLRELGFAELESRLPIDALRPPRS